VEEVVEEEEEETVTQERRKRHNEKLFNMYRALSIIKNTKARTMIWAQNMACLREKRVTQGFGEET
jgi:hypothetical protein